MNILFYGDNLVWLRDNRYFPDESIDLIYLDPPFNSKADYNVLFKEPSGGENSQAQIRAFDDTWHWDSEASEIALNELAHNKPQIAEFVSWLSRQGKTNKSIAAYLSMMAIRLIELYRVLKQEGSLYLHCDPTASHYLKIVLDQIFSSKFFRNEIVWCYDIGGRISKTNYGRRHDTILFYTKSDKYTFNWDKILAPFSESGKAKFRYEDDIGKYRLMGRFITGSPIKGHRDVSPEWEKSHPGLVYRHYLKPGRMAVDWWSIPPINQASKERLGYPTQKPLDLLEHIVEASSNENDIVLDPFCGCGTTIDAAHKLNRHWFGIDVTWLAIDLVEKRLKETYGQKIADTYEVKGKPVDVFSARALANKSKKEFEIWAISLVGAHPREHDAGVDGIFGFVEKDKKTRTIIVQVKGGSVLNPGMVRDLKGTVENEGAAIGLLITLSEPTSGMKGLAVHSPRYKSELWNREFPSIQIRTIAELLGGKGFDLPPVVSLFKKAQLAKEDATQLGIANVVVKEAVPYSNPD